MKTEGQITTLLITDRDKSLKRRLSDIIHGATPGKAQTGKKMNRRFQTGSISKHGNWWFVRFRVDTPGQTKRQLRHERICPTYGPGLLKSFERKQRAQEILTAAGVNSADRFKQISSAGLTFREQGCKFMEWARTRKKKPVKCSTLIGWAAALNWLNPLIGELPLSQIDNVTLGQAINEMHKKGLSAKTILNYAQAAKMVVASARDDRGNRLYPMQWDSTVLDLPSIGKQHQPVFSMEQISQIVATANRREQVIFTLLAATGMRAGECFGLEIKHLSQNCSTVTVEQSAWTSRLQTPKTLNANRQIDLPITVAKMLAEFIGDRKTGLLFPGVAGRPLAQSKILVRYLHPICEKLGIPQQGFHSFRRARLTWLRNNSVPWDIEKFWIGHGDKDITDRYSKLSMDTVLRKQTAERIGTGFVVPVLKSDADSVVYKVRKSAQAAKKEDAG